MTADPAPALWSPDEPELCELGPEDEIDSGHLDAYLRSALPALRGPLSVQRFAASRTSRAYRLQVGATRLVLRRLPGGPNLSRELELLDGLSRRYARAPRPLHQCDDPTVIGSRFLLTQHFPGVVIRRRLPNAMVLLPDIGERLATAVVAALVDLHRCTSSPGAAVRAHGAFALSRCLFADDDPDHVTGVLGWGRVGTGEPLDDLRHLAQTWPATLDEVRGSPVRLPPPRRLFELYEHSIAVPPSVARDAPQRSGKDFA